MQASKSKFTHSIITTTISNKSKVLYTVHSKQIAMEMDMVSGTYLCAPGSKTKTKIGIFYLSTAPTLTYS